ncbi:MAG: ribosomal protein small subunit ribosomal protein [Parcubacteria group bacterium]|nr:ribosomal protein small subunit ribosomal protein [Parcubacteria group bacterium]
MIRFQRIGRKNDAAFRIAVLEKTAGPKAGKYVDLVGTYNPKTKLSTLKPEAIKDWMSKGAQVSPSVHNLLVKEGVLEGAKSAKVVSKTNLEKNIMKKKAEDEAAAAKAAADEAKAAADAKAAEEAAAAAAPEAPAEVETPAEEAAPAVEEAPAEVEAPAETPEAAPEVEVPTETAA